MGAISFTLSSSFLNNFSNIKELKLWLTMLAFEHTLYSVIDVYFTIFLLFILLHLLFRGIRCNQWQFDLIQFDLINENKSPKKAGGHIRLQIKKVSTQKEGNSRN